MNERGGARRRWKRPTKLGGALAIAGLIVVLTAAPAWAHAEFKSSVPAGGSTVDVAPKQLELTWSESVEISFGSIKVFDQKGDRVDILALHHGPKGDSTVDARLPHLADGAYVVTWRVISADSHPVHGAFTFIVGHSSTDAQGLAAKLESEGGGNTTVGVLYAIARAALFAGLALLIGSAVFAAAVRPHGKRRSRADALVWVGWIVLFVSTILALLLQGPYAGGLKLTEMFHVAVVRSVLRTRYGHFAELRLVLLFAALPLIFKLRKSWRPNGVWWAIATPLGAVLAATPGLAGHAATGTFTQFAIPADAVHVVAMSIWLGGLASLGLIVLDRDPDAGRAAARFSPVALTSVLLIVASGLLASWRQVGFTVDAYTHTTYGRLLLVKVGVFLVLIALAAWSRKVVRTRRPATLSAMAVDTESSIRTRALPEDPDVRRLRWSVWGELVFGIAVLTITAMLVNAQPARSALSLPYSKEFREANMSINLLIDPAKAGPVDMHIYTLSPAGANLFTPGITAELSQPSKGIPPIEVPLVRGGPNHYLACLGPPAQAGTGTVTCSDKFSIPYSGKWTLVIRALRNEFDETAVQTTVNIR
jgi:copper transport protein